MSVDRVTARLPGVTYECELQADAGAEPFKVLITVASHPASGAPHEIMFARKDKTTQSFDAMLNQLGIYASRAIQGRDPMTGEASP